MPRHACPHTRTASDVETSMGCNQRQTHLQRCMLRSAPAHSYPTPGGNLVATTPPRGDLTTTASCTAPTQVRCVTNQPACKEENASPIWPVERLQGAAPGATPTVPLSGGWESRSLSTPRRSASCIASNRGCSGPQSKHLSSWVRKDAAPGLPLCMFAGGSTRSPLNTQRSG